MHVQLKVNARTIVSADGASMAEVFEQLAGLQEVFGCCERCGLCQSERLRYVVRENDGYKFFEVHCGACKARFVFGQSKQHPGALFPQRKDRDGQVKPDGGWTRWEPEQPQATATPATKTAAKPAVTSNDNRRNGNTPTQRRC